MDIRVGDILDNMSGQIVKVLSRPYLGELNCYVCSVIHISGAFTGEFSDEYHITYNTGQPRVKLLNCGLRPTRNIKKITL